MSLKDIRKALNDSPEEQLASILEANRGVLPIRNIRFIAVVDIGLQ